MTAPERLLIVTTRSRLRSVRFLPVMLVASRRVRRQLGTTEGLVRSASIIAGPTEFWTITVWRSPHAMQEFMRSGVHGRIMWRFSRWLRSFWLMRWRSGPEELGRFEGLELSSPVERTGAAAHRTALSDSVLQGIPSLLAAMATDGRPTYDSATTVRRRRTQVAGRGGAVIRVRVSVPGLPAALIALCRLRRSLGSHPDLVRTALGMARPGELYLLSVWRDQDAAARLVEGSWARAAAARWQEGFWANRWVPENEFGHWDGMRLRREGRRPRVAPGVSRATKGAAGSAPA